MSKGVSLVLKTIAEIAPGVEAMEEKLSDLNLEAGIKWREREQIRTAQGHLTKVTDLLQDMAWNIGTKEAVAVIELVWGPLPDDEK
jgi:hypothetical protein